MLSTLGALQSCRRTCSWLGGSGEKPNGEDYSAMWTYRASDDKKKKGAKRRVTLSVGKNMHRHSKGKGGNKYAWSKDDEERARKKAKRVEEPSETGEGSQAGTIEVSGDTEDDTQDDTQDDTVGGGQTPESQDSLLDTQDDE